MTGASSVAVIGLGAIGGSVALRLVERGLPPHGFTPDAADADAARAAGVWVAPTIGLAAANAGIIMLAVPLDALASVADAVLRAAPPDATIMHLCSLQRADAVRLSSASAHDRVIGTHPLAGTHRAGFRAASATVFEGATVYGERRASPSARLVIDFIWRTAGVARIEYIDALDHDRLMARVSHLPQLVGTALASVLARRGVTLDQLGPGARDATRLAASSLGIWGPLLERAPSETADLLGEVEEVLAELQAACVSRDRVHLAETWNNARSWRLGAGG